MGDDRGAGGNFGSRGELGMSPQNHFALSVGHQGTRVLPTRVLTSRNGNVMYDYLACLEL